MKRVLQIIPTLQYGGISSVVSGWSEVSHHIDYHFDYIAFNDGPLKKVFEDQGATVYVLPTIRKNPVAYFLGLIHIFFAERYDVVHVHNSFKNGMALLLARLMRVKVRVCHAHTSGLEDKSLGFSLSILKFLAVKNATVRLACSRKAGDFLYGKQPFSVLNNAIDVQSILDEAGDSDATKERYCLPKNKIIVGHVGRFVAVKNHEFILKLAQSLSDDYHFALVGSGGLRDKIKKQVLDLGLSSRFSFIEPTKEIPAILRTFDVFVLPSFFEGLSMVALEAQASRLPCIVSDRVPPEADVGLGLLTYLPLEDFHSWVRLIKNLPRIEISRADVDAAFNKKGYTTRSLVQKIKEVYG